jgi:hypothetical protein
MAFDELEKGWRGHIRRRAYNDMQSGAARRRGVGRGRAPRAARPCHACRRAAAAAASAWGPGVGSSTGNRLVRAPAGRGPGAPAQRAHLVRSLPGILAACAAAEPGRGVLGAARGCCQRAAKTEKQSPLPTNPATLSPSPPPTCPRSTRLRQAPRLTLRRAEPIGRVALRRRVERPRRRVGRRRRRRAKLRLLPRRGGGGAAAERAARRASAMRRSRRGGGRRQAGRVRHARWQLLGCERRQLHGRRRCGQQRGGVHGADERVGQCVDGGGAVAGRLGGALGRRRELARVVGVADDVLGLGWGKGGWVRGRGGVGRETRGACGTGCAAQSARPQPSSGSLRTRRAALPVGVLWGSRL